MDYKTLGRTDLRVSTLCLGSMTWGSQNSEAEGHAQFDYALGKGINFIDTAEMYPANPGPADYAGKTEEYIGTWVEKSGKRNDVILATKITGEGSSRARGGAPIDPAGIRQSLDGSLKRSEDRLCRSLSTALAEPGQLPLPQVLGIRSFRRQSH